MNATKILWGQVLVVSCVVLAFLWGATEWVAWRLAFQAPLGRPWFVAFGWPLYQPPAFFWWWFASDAYAREISLKAPISRLPVVSPLSSLRSRCRSGARER